MALLTANHKGEDIVQANCGVLHTNRVVALTLLLKTNWAAWHRWLGLITCAAILLWGVSGLAHPIMSRLQPNPAVFSAPVVNFDLSTALTPGAVLKQNNIALLQRLSVIRFDKQSYYRVTTTTDQPARYFATDSGHELMDGDRRYAEFLACYYSGLKPSQITDSRLVTTYSDDYHSVNQILPVWRVAFAGNGHLRGFIDTDQARLSTLVDDTRFVLTKLFRFGHNWSFVERWPWLQLSLMMLALSCALVSALSGFWLYFSRRRNSRQHLALQPSKQWHRRLGLLVALTTLTFASSGIFHLLMDFQHAQQPKQMIEPATFSTGQLDNEAWKQLTALPFSKIDLVAVVSQPLWLVQRTDNTTLTAHVQVAALAHAEHHHASATHPTETDQPSISLIAANGGESIISNVMSLAQVQAATYAGQPVKAITQSALVNGFEGEYGFIFKRLPVIRVEFAGKNHPRYYMEPTTAALAAKIEDMDATEGWSFAYIHKWQFFNNHKDWRDALMMLFALGNISVALLGVWLFSRPRR